MSEKNTVLSLRVNEKELDFLKSFASENNMVSGNGFPSPAKAAKHLIRLSSLGKSVEKGSSDSNKLNRILDLVEQIYEENVIKKLDHLLKLVEQIHVAQPHIVHHSIFSSTVLAKTIDKDKLDYISGRAHKRRKLILGQYQTVNYQKAAVSKNEQGMTILPLEEDESE